MYEGVYEGVVTAVNSSAGYAFAKVTGVGDVFIHCRDCPSDIEFDSRLQYRRLKFEVVATERGLRAKHVTSA